MSGRSKCGVLAPALLPLLVVCSGSHDAARKESVARVARAVEVLRNAPNQAKSEPLRALQKAACATPDICEVRDLCWVAYALYLEGVELTEAARRELATGKDLEAARLLGAAQQKLEQASPKVAICTDREAALRRRHKL